MFIFNIASFSQTVLFDNTHDQNVGNSDWTISGGYSDFADLLEKNGYKIIKEKTYLWDNLSKIDILVIPEPNKPFNKSEIINILKFVKNGGNLFLIANHGGADRNGNSYDSVKVFNEFVYHFGITINSNHFSEIGLKILNSKINHKVKTIAAFAGSTINIIDSDLSTPIIYSENGIFGTESHYGKGKVITIGDSAIFDDGTGTDGKHLHNVFNSITYDHQQFALNIFTYLSNKDFIFFNKEIPFNELKENSITIDIFHGNNGADNTEQFMTDISELKNVYYSSTPLNDKILKKTDILIIHEPNIPFTQKEIYLLKKYKDVKIIFLASSSFNALNLDYTNELIKRISGKDLYFHKNQVLDSKMSVEGKPWTFISEEKIYKTIVFSACSVGGSEKHSALLKSSTNSYTDGEPALKGSSSLIIRSDDLRITLIGFSLFSNYNFSKSIFYSDNYKKVLHNTENYIKYLIKKIDGDV